MKIFENKTAIEVAGLLPHQQPFVETIVVRYLPENRGLLVIEAPAIYTSHTYIDFTDGTPGWVWDKLIDARDAGILLMDEKRSWAKVMPSIIIRHAVMTHNFVVEMANEVFMEKE